MNVCSMVGNLTRDPEIQTYENSQKCKFSIAINRQRPNADGTRQADFIPVTAWNKLAAACMEYLQKGSKVAVTGRLTTYKYTNADGENRSGFEVTAESVEFIGRTKKQTDSEAEAAQPVQTDAQTGFVQVDENDLLPF